MDTNLSGQQFYDETKSKIASFCADADFEARVLCEETTGLTYAQLKITDSIAKHLTVEKIAFYHDAIIRKRRGEPMPFIFRSMVFFGHRIYVDNRVLFPRWETERLAEACVDLVKELPAGSRMLDMGTGSGCLSLTVGLAVPTVTGVCLDYSEDALEVCKLNIERYGLLDRFQFVQSDWYKSLETSAYPQPQMFDFIVVNPPYISEDEWNAYDEAAKTYEPEVAFIGKDRKTGLDCYESILEGAPRHLKPGCKLAVEIGKDQGSAVKKLFEARGFTDVKTRGDWNGIDRVVYGTWPGTK